MATADSVKNKLRGLISKANGTTGRSDATVTAAVDALISGYGKGGDAPSGTISITKNGSHNVAAYATANVQVPVPETVTEVHTITIASDLGAGTNTTKTILSGNSFVKANYAADGFSAMLTPLTPVASATGVGHWVYHGNRNVGSSNVARYGYFAYSTSASAVGFVGNSVKLSGTGWNISLRANSSGNIDLYVASSRTIKAGTYILVLTLAN